MRQVKVTVIGHFAFGMDYYDGQTVKTKIISNELEKIYTKAKIKRIDTHGTLKSFFRAPLVVFEAVKNSENIVILPANNGLLVYAPLLISLNALNKCKLHYIVIGGWLPDYLHKHRLIKKILPNFCGVYVETVSMKLALNGLGIMNAHVMPNCKDIKIIPVNEVVKFDSQKTYKVCTFSRVMREKGIEDAIEAVSMINKKYNRTVFCLDIYGQIDSKQKDWFQSLRKDFPDYIQYCGIIPYEKTTSTIKDYFTLLFPTYYEGEGFAGTIIDAMAAGVPVLASDWKYNSEIIVTGVNGFLFSPHHPEEIVDLLEDAIGNLSMWNCMREKCSTIAKKYLPENVISVLTERL